MLQEFKEFIAEGNVLDTAVGIVIGAAFKSIIDSFVADIITPILSIFLDGVDFSEWTLEVGPITFGIGNFINNVVSFLIIALVMFALVKAANRLRRKEEEKPNEKTCPYCKTEIAIEATRCPNCTSELDLAESTSI